MRTSFIQDRIARFQRSTTALRPYSTDRVTLAQSHFGGVPNMAGLPGYPECPHCTRPMGSVLQVYRRDVPEAYFPEDADLFHVFRCTNDACEGDYAHYDLATLAMFSRVGDAVRELPAPAGAQASKVCALSPKVMEDMPNFDDYPDDEPAIAVKFGDDLEEFFIDEHSALSATKFGGWPSFTQSPFYPACTCGKVKEFFFQLSSEDQLQVEGRPEVEDWSPHGIMMGDVGNIYFYVCRSCGPKTIESYFDCH